MSERYLSQVTREGEASCMCKSHFKALANFVQQPRCRMQEVLGAGARACRACMQIPVQGIRVNRASGIRKAEEEEEEEARSKVTYFIGETSIQIPQYRANSFSEFGATRFVFFPLRALLFESVVTRRL